MQATSEECFKIPSACVSAFSTSSAKVYRRRISNLLSPYPADLYGEARDAGGAKSDLMRRAGDPTDVDRVPPILTPSWSFIMPRPFHTENDIPPYANTSLEIEKRWKSAILRDSRRSSALQRPEPPNFEIGWKRTKEIKVEKPKGWVVADFLDKLETLMGRGQFGSPALLAKTGEIVAERAREEAEVLLAGGEVEDRMVTELNRVLRLMEMDLAMVRAAVKEETLAERVEQARARCRQAILVALSF
ncbi:hypothetical protein ZIOFF_074000 [Zingiber officinale]|uniref:Chlororespiratory reduction 41 n=1 Tax=Zingiber officinale TaxID=94328 RepID=A0A8J5CA33_ZINOF|nr:hypothetical protein ZIOFF_074000 [Zingiber officinale]